MGIYCKDLNRRYLGETKIWENLGHCPAPAVQMPLGRQRQGGVSGRQCGIGKGER